jgi:hypothetical protein
LTDKDAVENSSVGLYKIVDYVILSPSHSAYTLHVIENNVLQMIHCPKNLIFDIF